MHQESAKPTRPSVEPLKPGLARYKSSTFDDFSSAVRGWSLDFRQIDAGPWQSEILQVCGDGFQLAHASFNRLIDQKGSSPAGLWTFAVQGESSAPIAWRGRRIPRDAIMIYPPGGEIMAVSQPGFDVFAVSLAEPLLAEVAETLGICAVPKQMYSQADSYQCDLDALTGVRRLLSAVCDGPLSDSPPARPQLAAGQELARGLLAALGSSRPMDIPPARWLRCQALARAEQYIEEHRHRPLTVHAVCRAVHVSERTLRYAFVDRYGVPPKTYLRAIRLNGARRGLLRADPATTRVCEIAGEWGFWHMGQFAADYRRLFCELPSQTLNTGQYTR